MAHDIRQVMSDFRRARLLELKALGKLKEAPTKENLQIWVTAVIESRKQEINAIEREFFSHLKCYQTRLLQNRKRRR